MSARDKICVGVITGAHGVKGAVRVKSFTARPKDIAAYGPVSDEKGEQVFEIQVTGTAKDRVIARLSGIDDRDAAEALKGVDLFVARDALPPAGQDEFYHTDLVGLRAEAEDGTDMGTVRALHDFGAGDLIEIQGPDGAPLVLPFTRAAVPVIDLEGGRIVVAPPPGLMGPLDGDGETEEEKRQ